MRTAQGFPFASLPTVVTLGLLLCGALVTTATAQPTLEVRNDDGELLAPGAADELGILGEPRLLHYTVTNTGNEPLEFAAELANDRDAAATLQNEPDAPLAPGESLVLCLWLGVNTWRFSVELHLTSNDPNAAQHITTVRGNMRFAGAYTIDNTQPTAGRNFADFGDAFDSLEEVGTSDAVDFEIFGQGGVYTATPAYALGVAHEPESITERFRLPERDPSTMPITLRAAPGERVIVEGDGVTLFGRPEMTGALFITVPNVTVDGLEVRNASGFGVYAYGEVGLPVWDITVRNCRIHNIVGQGIIIQGDDAAHLGTPLLENNIVWNCGGESLINENIHGLVGLHNVTDAVVRHNTLIANEALIEQAAALSITSTHTRPTTLAVANNVFVVLAPNRSMLNVSLFVEFFFAQGNVYHFATDDPGPFATGHGPRDPSRSPIEPTPPFGVVRYETFEQWRDSRGVDHTGQLAEALLTDPHADPPDVRLQPGSPAIEAGVYTPLAEDIFGNRRPRGAAADAGAYEFPSADAPGVEVILDGAPIVPEASHEFIGATVLHEASPLAEDIFGNRRPRGAAADAGAFEFPSADAPGVEVILDGAPVVPEASREFIGATVLHEASPLYFTLRNTGTATLRIDDIRILEAQGGMARLETPVPSTLEPGEARSLIVSIRANLSEWRVGLKICSNALRRPLYRFAVFGVAGEERPHMLVWQHPDGIHPQYPAETRARIRIFDDGVRDLGNVLIGEQQQLDLTLDNRIIFRHIPLKLTGDPPVQFSEVINAEVSAEPAGVLIPTTEVMGDLRIRVNPLALGEFSVRVTLPNNTDNFPLFSFTITGVAVDQPRLEVLRETAAEDPVEFGGVLAYEARVGELAQLPLALRNVGTRRLLVDAVTILEDCSGLFAVVEQAPRKIAPSATGTAILEATPTRAGQFVATLAVESDDPRFEPYFVFTLLLNVEGDDDTTDPATAVSTAAEQGCGIAPRGTAFVAFTFAVVVLLFALARRRRFTRKGVAP